MFGNNQKEIAILGGGCFWCMEAIFNEIKGVEKVIPGYSGGSLENPTYKEVSTGITGHVEVVQIHFKPAVISYKDILKIFFTIHDPTTINQQGADIGSQYRSVVFFHNNKQRVIAEKIISELNSAKVYNSQIITKVEPFTRFYVAEDYHIDYFNKHSNQPYCIAVILPKVVKLRKEFSNKLKKI
jgi:methionine-S-sulfoxide reductase